MQSDKYQILIDSMVRAMRAGVPGAKVKEVTKGMNDTIAESGYGKYCYPPYMRVRGHGFGLGSTHPGQLTMENETILEEGLMFIVHPNQYIPEDGVPIVRRNGRCHEDRSCSTADPLALRFRLYPGID